MSSLPPVIETRSIPVPRMVVDLPSRPRLFFSNLRDVLAPQGPSALDLRSAPADFWPDVFVQRPLPWSGFLQSVACHVIAVFLLILTHIMSLQPQVVATTAFDHSQVIYYQPSEYLPPLDTREADNSESQKADPELSPQPIISVPPEADSRSQTLVTAPNVKLKRDVLMPNVVSWADQPTPTLAIPAAPLTPAADLQRLAPKLEDSVVAPPPDAALLDQRRNSPAFQSSIVAPPPDLRTAKDAASIPGLQPALISPPPAIQNSSARFGDLTISPSAVIAPAPQLSVAPQRSAPGGRFTTMPAGAQQVVAPPPSVPGSSSAGSRGRMIALNLHPTVGAPPDSSVGNRRGSFSANSEGHPGATGTPGTASGSAKSGGAAKGNGKDSSGGSSRKNLADLPSGLYVGNETAKTSPVAGDSAGQPSSTVNPNLLASARPPRITATRPMQPESATKLSEPERAVFGNRKFYSVTLNMPNLNSAGGSWIIRFAEAKHESGPHDASVLSPDLSQPMATRKVDPAYPMQLMRENVAGTVILYGVIHADGTVGSVRVLRSVDDRLDRYAAEALAQWKFEPATKSGVPVDVEATFQIPFRPSRLGSNF